MKANKKAIIIYTAIGIFITTIVVSLIIRKQRNNKRGLKILNKNPKNILIIGDSQSAVQTPSGQKILFTYPNLLKTKLNEKGINIDVVALQGKNTSWMKEQLRNQLSAKKYDRVIIYGGGNDASNSSIKISTIIQNIQDMVNMSIDSGADAFVNLGYKIQGDFGNHLIMPITQFVTTKEDWIPLVERRKELQRLIPKKIKNAHFIQPYDLQNKTSDGIHPTPSGHKLVADAVYDSIVKIT